jgi:carbon monoxide dehydrogenase subunit G
MAQYESSTFCIPYSQERVYAKLENLSNLEALKEKLPADKVKEFECDRDSVTADVPPVGKVTLRVVEREEPKCVKFAADNSPLPFNMWVHVIPDGAEGSKMRVVVKAEINFMLKGMIEKPLKDALEKIGEVLSKIPY